MTRSAIPLERDFVVYGYKNVEDAYQAVFGGYNVKYREGSANTSEDNTHGYYYVGGEQTIKYWDYSATEYRYWGYTGGKSNFSNDGKALTIPVTGLLAASEPTSTAYFSSLYIRKPVSSDVVTLEFKRPYTKIRVLFYSSQPIDAGDKIIVSTPVFVPDQAALDPLVTKVYKAGDVQITYPLDTEKTSEEFNATPSSASADALEGLSYKDVTLTHDAGTSLTNSVLAKTTLTAEGTEYYYTLPMGEKNPAFIMTATVSGEQKTAVVPAEYMHWKPNYQYTYVFKITEAGKKMEFYDVMIDPWKYGGSQEEVWKNW